MGPFVIVVISRGVRESKKNTGREKCESDSRARDDNDDTTVSSWGDGYILKARGGDRHRLITKAPRPTGTVRRCRYRRRQRRGDVVVTVALTRATLKADQWPPVRNACLDLSVPIAPRAPPRRHRA